MPRKRRIMNITVSMLLLLTVLVYSDYRKYDELMIKSNLLEAFIITGFVVVGFWYIDFIDKREEKKNKKKENEEDA